MDQTVIAAFDAGREERRLLALRNLALLDSAPEREFDALAALASEMLGCPIAALTVIDRDRQWFKARVGVQAEESSREEAFCDHTIRCTAPMVIDDATRDPRFADNSWVTQEGVRFYAGAPIHTVDRDGERHAIGALCVLDTAPRSLNAAGERALLHFASLAEALIAARQMARDALAMMRTSDEQAAELARQHRVLRQAERLAMMGSWRLALDDDKVQWSDGVYRIHGIPVGSAPQLDQALDHYPPHARAAVSAALAQTIETGEPFDMELDFVTAQGERRRVRSIGEREETAGRPSALIGVFQDVTERHNLEQSLRAAADIDPLTGLANRAVFDRAVEDGMERARRDGSHLLLALVDLDAFKKINDTFGHAAGDDVLRQVGKTLRAGWLGRSTVARIGGDEFAVIVDDPAVAATPEALADRLEAELRLSIVADGITIAAAATVGAACFAPECRTVRDFAKRADAMLYAGKRARVGDRPLAA